MNKLYSVHDHWTDINKKNDVDIESIDGVITGIKVNGEDYGGGGSSDFSTAEVTVINNTRNNIQCLNVKVLDTPLPGVITGSTFFDGSKTYIVPLYKGLCVWAINGPVNVSVSGAIEWDSEEAEVYIKGNGTITIS